MNEKMLRLLAEGEAELASDTSGEARPGDHRASGRRPSPEVQQRLRRLLGGHS